MAKVKVRAIEYNDKMDFVFNDWISACNFMMDAANNHVPHEQYARDELYPVKFEVELVPDADEVIDFEDLEEIPVEDVKEDE